LIKEVNMSKNDYYGNRYPGAGTTAPGFGYSKPDESFPEVPELTSDELQAEYKSMLDPYIK